MGNNGGRRQSILSNFMKFEKKSLTSGNSGLALNNPL